MQQKIVLTVQLLDVDGSPQYDDIVDFIPVNIFPVVSNNFSNIEQYNGLAGYASMTMSFRVTCSSNSYGSDCGTRCEERDDAFGHYTCSSTGERVCMTGYQDSATNCTHCVPATGCCE